MSVRPSSVEEISAALRAASASRTPLQPLDLCGLSRMVEYTPEDMTATVEGGMTLGLLQQTLNASGQWLPIDPPNPDRTTLADLLAFDRSGPPALWVRNHSRLPDWNQSGPRQRRSHQSRGQGC